jgi:hypothetical protein
MVAPIIGISILPLRSNRAYSVRVEAPPSRFLVPAGSHLSLKIAESVLQNGKAGETFEALTTQLIQPKRGNPYCTRGGHGSSDVCF